MPMSTGKLERVIATLTPLERERLGRFLAADYFNSREDVRRLYGSLVGGTAESPEGHWTVVHPDQGFDVAKWRHLRNYLLRSIEDFLAVEALRQDDAHRSLAVARAYGARGLRQMEVATLQKGQQRLARRPRRDAAHYQTQVNFRTQEYNAAFQRKRSARAEIGDWAESLDHFYILTRLQQACSIATQQSVFHTETALPWLDLVLQRAQEPPFSSETAIQLYFHAHQMLSAPDGHPHYQQLNQLLHDFPDIFPPSDLRSLYIMVINFAIRSLNSGDQSYRAELFSLYQRGLEQGWLLEQGQLSPWTYKNMVSIGLKLDRFEEVDQFIQDYRLRLPAEFQSDLPGYCKAELQLAEGQPAKVFQTLRFIRIQDPLIDLRARVLQLKAAYALGEMELIESQSEALRQLLRRRKQLTYHRERYEEFLGFFKRILALAPRDRAGRQELEKEVGERDQLVEKEWLLEVVEKVG